MSKETIPVYTNTQTFYIPGSRVQTAIYERAKRHQDEIDRCLLWITSYLADKASAKNDTPSKLCSSVMLALGVGKNLTSDALMVKAQLDRAIYLTNEVTDLSFIAKNIDSHAVYAITLDEAKRYGLL
jgi:tartrate dehydratase alpha subunit/fumarate hydratase class I-like protein